MVATNFTIRKNLYNRIIFNLVIIMMWWNYQFMSCNGLLCYLKIVSISLTNNTTSRFNDPMMLLRGQPSLGRGLVILNYLFSFIFILFSSMSQVIWLRPDKKSFLYKTCFIVLYLYHSIFMSFLNYKNFWLKNSINIIEAIEDRDSQNVVKALI